MYYASDGVWAGALTIPNTSPMLVSGVPPGNWSVTVSDFAHECGGFSNCSLAYAYPPSNYDLTVILKQGPIASTGTLAVVFYLLTTDWDSSSDPEAAAAADPRIVRMVASLQKLLAVAKITVGTPSFVNLPASVKAHFATGVNADDTSPCGDLATLFQNSDAEVAMNLFLVDPDYLVDVFAGWQAHRGRRRNHPRAFTVGKTVQSGAVASVANLTGLAGCSANVIDPQGCAPDELAYIAAHETGHFLGLYHPTEFDGAMFDPLTDTPECPCSKCRPSGRPRPARRRTVPRPTSMRWRGTTASRQAQDAGAGRT